MAGSETPRPEPTDWRLEAACRTKSPELFYPTNRRKTAAARAICAACPVRQACLDHAIANREPEGIWGGMDEVEREREHRRRRYWARRAGQPVRPNPEKIILDHLGTFGAWNGTITALAAELGLARDTVSKHVNRLHRDGRLYIDRHGIYLADLHRARAWAKEVSA